MMEKKLHPWRQKPVKIRDPFLSSPEYKKAYKAYYRKKNSNKFRQYGATRRARVKASTVGKVDYPELLRQFNGVCPLCLTTLDVTADKYHVDHKIPLSKYGEHCNDNLQITHVFCNLSKGAKLLDK